MWLVVALRTLVRPVRPAARPCARKRARAVVFAGLFAILAFQFAMLVAVNTIRARWRDPEFFHRAQKLTAARGQRTVAVLGSSRPQMGFSPDHAADGYGPDAPLIFNLCQTGCQPLGERLNLRRLMNGKRKPDYVLVEVLPSALAERRMLDDQIAVSRFSPADLATVTPYFDDPATVRGRWASAQAAPWYTHRVNLLAHAGLADLTPAGLRQDFLWADMRSNGWSPYYPPVWSKADQERRLAAALRQFAEPLGNYRIHPQVAAAHRDLLAECRENGVRAALFLMPESPTFRTLYSADAKRELREYLDGLSRDFGVPVFDASEWIADESAYMDGYHLLGPGAEAFSRRFGRECLGAWLSPR